MKKQILSFVLVLCMAFTMCLLNVLPISAQTGSLVAIGDSITTGYGLEGYTKSPAPNAKDSYVNRLAEQLGVTTVNLAIDGITSEGLLAALKATSSDENGMQYKALQSADVIAVTIGGNDLLGALYIEVGTALGLDLKSATLKTQVQTKAAAAFETNNLTTLTKINSALISLNEKIEPLAKAYETNLTQLIAALKAINPNATIIVQTIANPYKGIKGIGTTVDAGVIAFNKVITKGSAEGIYTVAEVYKAFNESSSVLTNASNPATYLDPHPNKDGHGVIAKIIAGMLGSQIETAKPQAEAQQPQTKEPVRAVTIPKPAAN